MGRYSEVQHNGLPRRDQKEARRRGGLKKANERRLGLIGEREERAKGKRAMRFGELQPTVVRPSKSVPNERVLKEIFVGEAASGSEGNAR